MNIENSIIIKRKINAPIEKVWKALTDKNELPSWYFDIADFDAEVGKSFKFYEPGEEKKYLHQIDVIEVVPNEKLKHSWFYPDFSGEKTFVTWNLQEDENGTLVTLIHEGIENLKDLGKEFSDDNFTKGWEIIIGQNLKFHVTK